MLAQFVPISNCTGILGGTHSTYYLIQTMYYVTKSLAIFLIDALHAAWKFLPYMYSCCTVNTFNTVTSVTTVITLTIVTTIPCCNIVTVN